jgi:drug/metabolite transporter (DMT)-like permease
MFSYPIRILFGEAFFAKSINRGLILKVCLGLVGLLLVSGVELSSVFTSSGFLVYPLAASFFIALWIVISNRLKKTELNSVALSFSYDFITLVFLLFFMFQGLEQTYPQFLDWSSSFNHWGALVLYSVVIGLLPNLLFYKGSQSLSPVVVALIMSSEPLFSTVYTSFIWKEAFSLSFFMGAALIILVNLPNGFFRKIKYFKIKEVLQFS